MPRYYSANRGQNVPPLAAEGLPSLTEGEHYDFIHATPPHIDVDFIVAVQDGKFIGMSRTMERDPSADGLPKECDRWYFRSDHLAATADWAQAQPIAAYFCSAR